MIKLKDLLSEAITIDVKVGDTILTGRFKNKKTVVKKIGVDDHGMPTINGRKVVTFRMGKKVNVFDKENITERVDFLETASQIVKQQGLKSKIKFGKIKAWKFHTKMILNLIVPVGKVKFVFYSQKKPTTLVLYPVSIS